MTTILFCGVDRVEQQIGDLVVLADVGLGSRASAAVVVIVVLSKEEQQHYYQYYHVPRLALLD